MAEKKKLSKVEALASGATLSDDDSLIAEVGGSLRRVSISTITGTLSGSSDLVNVIDALVENQGIYTFDNLSVADGSSIGTCRLKSTDPVSEIDAQIPAFYIEDGVAYKVSEVYNNNSTNDSAYETGIGCGSSVKDVDTYIKSLSLPKTITTLGGGVLSRMKNLESVSLGGSVKFTSMRLQFFGDNSLTSVPAANMDTSEATEWHGAFSACKSLTALPDLDYSAAKIGTYMCYNNTSLTSFSLTAPR